MASTNTNSGSAYTISNSANTGTISLNNASTISNTLSLDYNSLYSYTYTNSNFTLKNVIIDDVVSETTIRSLLIDYKDKEIDSDIYDIMLRNRKLSERFLDDFFDKLNIATLLSSQMVSFRFIENHLDAIKDSEEACAALSRTQEIDEVFISKYPDLIAWDSLAANTSVKFTVPFLLKYVNNFSEDGLKALCKNVSLTAEVFNVFLDNISDDVRFKLDWRTISWNKELTEENILNNLDFLDFNSLLLATRKFSNDVITCYRKLKFGM